MSKLLRNILFGWGIGFGGTFGFLYALLVFFILTEKYVEDKREWYPSRSNR